MDDYAAAVYNGSNLFGLSDGFQMMLQLYDFQKLEKLFRPVNLPQTVGSKVIAIVCKEL